MLSCIHKHKRCFLRYKGGFEMADESKQLGEQLAETVNPLTEENKEKVLIFALGVSAAQGAQQTA